MFLLTLTFLFLATDCNFKEIQDPSKNYEVEIESDGTQSDCVAIFYSRALWNINSTDYWHYSNDIKTYLTIDSEGKNLKVSAYSP